MKVYVMVSRCGAALGEAVCSADYLDVYTVMRKQYEDALQDEVSLYRSW